MTLQELANHGLVWLGPCRYGQMFYLTTDYYIGRALQYYGEFSEGEVQIFRRIIKPGWTVLDIGANMGAHTVFMASVAGFVYSFEPQNILFQILENNIKLNSLSNTTVYNVAVGDNLGTIAIPEPDYSKPYNFGAIAMGTGNSTIPLITIDSLNLPACHFMKIDVEGMESKVIAGALNTINKYRPIIYLENEQVDRSTALIQQLWSLNYRLYWHLPPYYNPENYANNPANYYGNTISVNMLCLPKEIEQNETLKEVTRVNETWKELI